MSTRPCDERLWMEGKEAVCAAFLAAIPAARRAAWDRLLAAETPRQAQRPGIVYVVGLRRGAFASLPISEHLLEEAIDAAPVIEERLSDALDAFLRANAPPAPGTQT